MPDMDFTDQMIGNYRIEGPIGAGGIAQVFRARNLQTDRVVALKVLRGAFAGDATFRARFLQEAKATAGLHHPNIVQIYDFDEQNGRYYLAMELVPDGSLRTLLQQRAGNPQAWQPGFGLDLVRQAADGLAYAHANGVIHRDVKPDNLLLLRRVDTAGTTTGYTVKVSDFGLARLAEAHGMTASGFSVGTPAYMSPEQCQGLELDGRSDIYALGIVLYEVVVGRLPFISQTPSEAISQHVYMAPPPPRSVLPDIAPNLEAIILRCLAKIPADRFATATDLSNALQALLNLPEYSTVTAIPVAPTPDTTAPAVPVPADLTAEVPAALPASEEVTVPAQVSPLPAGSLSTPPLPGRTQTMIVASLPPSFPPLPSRTTIPQVQVVDAQGLQVQVLSLTGDGISVGRLPDNDVVLDSEAVSERHVQIDWDGNDVTVTDMGSKNGTFIAGTRLQAREPHPWDGATALQVGSFWLRLVPQLPSAILPSLGPSAIPDLNPQYRPPVAGSPFTDVPVGVAPSPISSPLQPGSLPGGGSQPARMTIPPPNPNKIDIQLEKDELTLTPGQASPVRVTLSNVGTLVDHLTVTVEGVPQTWIQGSPPSVQLNPGDRAPVALNVSAPRVPESRAGNYPVTIRARSRENPTQSGTALAQWKVQPFYENTLELKPKRVRGWRKANYSVIVGNAGNVPMSYALSGDDDEQVLEYQLAHEKVALEPGVAARVRLTVVSPRRWIGSSQSRSFTVRSKPEKIGEPQISSAQFIQRALIPAWLIPLLLLALIALIYFATRPPVIEAITTDPPTAVAGSPVTVQWQVSNTHRLELPTLTLTQVSDDVYKYTFKDATALPPELRVVAYSRFGIQQTSIAAIPYITLTPTSTPSATPTQSPTATPVPPTSPPPNTPVPPPTAPPPTPVPPPTTPPSPTPTRGSPTATSTPRNQILCPRDIHVDIDGTGPPSQPFLLYFNGRAVSGYSVTPDGTFHITMIVGQERPGNYTVEVRGRNDLQPFVIQRYQVDGDTPVTLTEPSASVTLTLTCIVPTATQTPTNR